jgi:3-phenylpropionate/trans-cinnamate dioxygenase ferredoxin reductase component
MSARKVDHLLIGGGLASANCARWLRESGAEGSVLVVGREPDAPYDRPPCSKGYLQGKESREDVAFRPAEWWQQHEIELLTRTSVLSLDAQTRTVKLSNKEEVEFDKALIATGANVRRLNVPGCELEEIHYLRALANADAIRASVQDAEHVVLIGGSYIGCEVAASLTLLGKHCTIVMQEDTVLERGFGEQAGGFFEGVLRSHGVAIHGGDQLERFEGDGRVARVITRRGLELPADTVVVGAGVTPEVRLAQSAGLQIGELGGVKCSSRLESSVPGVFAAGDMCEYQSVAHGRALRLEHWDVAFNHGKTAALNMLGGDQPHEMLPYFFSDLADWASMEYVGPAQDWDEEIVRGSYEDGAFSHWYLKDGRVLAALSVERSQDLDHARRLIRDGRPLGDRRALGDLDTDLGTLGS